MPVRWAQGAQQGLYPGLQGRELAGLGSSCSGLGWPPPVTSAPPPVTSTPQHPRVSPWPPPASLIQLLSPGLATLPLLGGFLILF